MKRVKFDLFQVSKMKVKRCAAAKEVYKLDVWIKGNLSGKKKLSFLLRKDDERNDVECNVYKSVLEEIRKYLATKPNVNRKHLPVPEAFVCNNPPDNEEAWSRFLYPRGHLMLRLHKTSFTRRPWP